jgi:hypothetical protein
MTLAGMNLEQRQAMRQRYLDKAASNAERMGLTARCKRVVSDLDHPDHQVCRGEDPGGAGCLCRCHDRVVTPAVDNLVS